MYKYKIGFTSCEESGFVELEHETKLVQKDISEMIAEYIRLKTPFLRKAVFGKHGVQKEYGTSFEEFFYAHQEELSEEKSLLSWLIKEKGFLPVVYEQVWTGWGWAEVLERDSWRSYRGGGEDVLDEVQDFLGLPPSKGAED